MLDGLACRAATIDSAWSISPRPLLVWSFSSCRSAVNSSTSWTRPNSGRGPPFRRRSRPIPVGAVREPLDSPGLVPGRLQPPPEPVEQLPRRPRNALDHGVSARFEQVGDRQPGIPAVGAAGRPPGPPASRSSSPSGTTAPAADGRVAQGLVGGMDVRESFRGPVGRELADQLEVSPADLGLAGVGGQPQGFIGIVHRSRHFFLRLLLRPGTPPAGFGARCGAVRNPAERRFEGVIVIPSSSSILVVEPDHIQESPARTKARRGIPARTGRRRTARIRSIASVTSLSEPSRSRMIGSRAIVLRVGRGLGQLQRDLQVFPRPGGGLAEHHGLESHLRHLDVGGFHLEHDRVGMLLHARLHQLLVERALLGITRPRNSATRSMSWRRNFRLVVLRR